MSLKDQDPIQQAMGGGIVAGAATGAGKAVETTDPSLITIIFEYFHISELGAILGTIWVFINITRWGYSALSAWRNRWINRNEKP